MMRDVIEALFVVAIIILTSVATIMVLISTLNTVITDYKMGGITCL